MKSYCIVTELYSRIILSLFLLRAAGLYDLEASMDTNYGMNSRHYSRDHALEDRLPVQQQTWSYLHYTNSSKVYRKVGSKYSLTIEGFTRITHNSYSYNDPSFCDPSTDEMK